MDTLDARKHEELQRSTRHGELKGELRQEVEVTRLQLAMASSKSKQRREGIFTRPQLAMASTFTCEAS